MIRKLLIILFFIGINIPASVNAGTINGNSDLDGGKYQSLTVNGNLNFKDLEIETKLVVNGNIKGKNLTCENIKINGHFNVERLKVKTIESSGAFNGTLINVTGNSKFNGGLKIKGAELESIEISGKKPILIDTKVNGDILIKKRKSNFFDNLKKQVLELSGDSIVYGNITFEKEGEIHLYDKAAVNGKIENAKIIKK